MNANGKETAGVSSENDMRQGAGHISANGTPDTSASSGTTSSRPEADGVRPEGRGGHAASVPRENSDSETNLSAAKKITINLNKEGNENQPAENAAAAETRENTNKGLGNGKKPGKCLKVFNALAHIGPLALLIFLALMVWPDFWRASAGEALYCPPEAVTISAFLNSVAGKTFLEPVGVAGGVLAAQWPGVAWLCALLALMPLPPAMLWPLCAALCAALALLAAWLFAKACSFGSRAAFASGLILLCTPVFAPLGHFVGKDTLAAACVILALACFTYGWLHEKAWFSLLLAFAATALGGLTAGPYCIVLPLLASIFFLVWRGRLSRAAHSDAICGFALMLAIIGAWLGLVIIKGTNAAYLKELLGNIWLSPWPPAADWWLIGLLALIGMLPWTILIICVSWVRVLKNCGRSLAASRHENGSAMPWIAAVVAWLLTFVISGCGDVAIVIMACLLAILCGKAFLNLPSAGQRLFFFICALGLLCAAIFIFASSFEFSQSFALSLLPFALPQPVAAQIIGMSGLLAVGVLCLFGAAVIFIRFLRGDQGAGPLIFCVILCVFLTQPAVLMIAPELGRSNADSLLTYEKIEQSLQKQALPDKTDSVLMTPQPGQLPAEPKNYPPSGEGELPAAEQDAPVLTAPEQLPQDNSAPENIEKPKPDVADVQDTQDAAQKNMLPQDIPATPSIQAPASAPAPTEEPKPDTPETVIIIDPQKNSVQPESALPAPYPDSGQSNNGSDAAESMQPGAKEPAAAPQNPGE